MLSHALRQLLGSDALKEIEHAARGKRRDRANRPDRITRGWLGERCGRAE
jgi:hypothetical protein